MPQAKPTTIPAYIAAAPREAQGNLRELYAILKKVAPKASEAVKWRSPVFEEGRILFAFAAYRSHINFLPTPAVIRHFQRELAAYRTGKASIQFPHDERLPVALIRKLAARRLKEVRENDARWM